MTTDEKKLFEGFLSKTLKMDTEGIATLFNEAGELVSIDSILELHEHKAAKIKSDNEAQYKRGIKEQAMKLEKELKSKFGIDSENIGVDLIDEIVEKETESVKAASTVKDDDIEKHPIFIAKRREFEKQIKAKETEYTEKLAAKQNEMRYEQTLAKVKTKAIAELKTMGAVFPEDANMASEWEKVFFNALTNQFKFNEDGEEIAILDKDGKPLQDAHANLMNLKGLVETVGKKYFSFKKADERSNSGNSDTKNYEHIKNEEDFVKAMQSAKTPQERAEILGKYNGQQKK